MQCSERIRKSIAACRQAGSEHRFEDAIDAAENAIAISSSSSIHQDDDFKRCIRLRAVALGYKGMALLSLKQFESSVLALEESYYSFLEQNFPTKNGTSSMIMNKVTLCLVQVCHILGRAPPLPPLVKFPRTAHIFRPAHSKAVTDDDLVLSKDNSMFRLLATPQHDDDPAAMHISLEEKIDGANLGISLSLNGEILVQNRSHYISHGEHAQFSQLAAWTEMHSKEIKRILLHGDENNDNSDDSNESSPTKRRILYGEWVVAKHSIKYERLPSYFIAFDISEDDRFVSRRRFHDIMRGSGIPVTPTLDHPDMTGMDQKELEKMLMDILRTTSQFRSDGGTLEGIVIRIDVDDWLQHRCKLVDPEFTAGITEHWAKSKIEKQRVDADFASIYLERCYHYSEKDLNAMHIAVTNPRQRAAVSYRSSGGCGTSATCTVLPKEPSSNREGVVILPRNLCWLWPDEVLVSSTPKSKEQIQAMHDALNVGLVITLTKEEPLPTEWFSGDCDNYFSPIPDGMTPTLQQMDEIGDAIVRIVSNNRSILEHCGGGKGRAGTIAACLLLRFGEGGIRTRLDAENRSNVGSGRFLLPREPFMSGQDAVNEIRRRRRGSLETVVQENFVREYAQYLWRTAAEVEDAFFEPIFEASSQVNEPATPVNPNKRMKRRVPKYIVLAGLPGSGKSTISKQLSLEDGHPNNEWVHASTDDMGKKTCCTVVGRVAAHVGQGRAGGIIVDACNINRSKRREWIDIMHRPSRSDTALVFFDVPAEVCVARVRCRVDHPTMPFGRGERVVESFVKQLELPTAKEAELFGQIAVLRSKGDISSLLLSWGIAT